jgi:hypothetical protein
MIGSTHLWNVGLFLRDYKAQYHRRRRLNQISLWW